MYAVLYAGHMLHICRIDRIHAAYMLYVCRVQLVYMRCIYTIHIRAYSMMLVLMICVHSKMLVCTKYDACADADADVAAVAAAADTDDAVDICVFTCCVCAEYMLHIYRTSRMYAACMLYVCRMPAAADAADMCAFTNASMHKT